MELVRKISRSTVYGTAGDVLEKIMADKKKPLPLYRVFGYCNGSRGGESDYGPWTALLGSFNAVNLETGEQYASGVAFIPQFAADTVLGQLDPSGGTRVQFAFDILAEWDTESDRPNYKYTARPLLEPSENDPLKELEKRLPALTGPAQPAKKQKALAAE